MKTFFIVWGMLLGVLYTVIGLAILLRHSPDWVTAVFASLVVTAAVAALTAIDN